MSLFSSSMNVSTALSVPHILLPTALFTTITNTTGNGQDVAELFNPFAVNVASQFALAGSNDPVRHLGKIDELMTSARQAALSKNNDASSTRYKEALKLLRAGGLYSSLDKGDVLYGEAVLGSVHGAAAHEIIPLQKELRALEWKLKGAEGDPLAQQKLLQVRLADVYLLVKYASEIKQQQPEIFARAEKKLQAVIDSICDGPLEDQLDPAFTADILKVELYSAMLQVESKRGDAGAKKELIKKLSDHLFYIRTVADYGSADKLAVLAQTQADTAFLFANLQLWGRALSVARRLTSSDRAPDYSSSSAAKDVLISDIFAPFVSEDKTRILSQAEIKTKRVSGYPFLKRLQAAVYAAHSNSLGEAAGFGAAGMLAGFGVDKLATGDVSPLSGIVGATLFSLGNQFKNGWRSEEAQSAGESGLFNRSGADMAIDAASLMVKAGGYSLAWWVPSFLSMYGAEAATIVGETFTAAAGKYGDFFSMIGNGIADPTFYANLASSVTNAQTQNEVLQYLVPLANLYAYTSGAYYFGNLLFPSLQERTKKYAPLFIPGAVWLSAKIGVSIGGLGKEGEYWPAFADRVERAAIVFGEIYLAMFTAGLASVAARKNIKEVGQSIVKGVLTTNYVMPLGAAIITGISSPLGGMLKSHIETDLLLLQFLQGAATTFGLLPITLGMSGLLKGTIPVFEGLSEGWQDANGHNPLIRLASSLRTAASEFNMPYTRNRAGRIAQFDVVPSGVRSIVGWDGNEGQAYMSGINAFYGNNAATMVWTEPSGTMWERDAIASRLTGANAGVGGALSAVNEGATTSDVARENARKALDLPHDIFTKSGQNMSFWHMLLPNDIVSRLYPLASFIRAAHPPKFPMQSNVFTYANLYQMLVGDSMNYNLNAAQVASLLDYVRIYAQNPENHVALKPVVKTLAIARESAEHGAAIRKLFYENSWLVDAFNIDFDALTIERSAYRRINRARVRKAIELPFSEYQSDMRFYSAGRKASQLRWLTQKLKTIAHIG